MIPSISRRFYHRSPVTAFQRAFWGPRARGAGCPQRVSPRTPPPPSRTPSRRGLAPEAAATVELLVRMRARAQLYGAITLQKTLRAFRARAQAAARPPSPGDARVRAVPVYYLPPWPNDHP